MKEGGLLGIGEAADPIKEKLALEKREKLLEDWVLYYLQSTYLADGRGLRISARATIGR